MPWPVDRPRPLCLPPLRETVLRETVLRETVRARSAVAARMPGATPAWVTSSGGSGYWPPPPRCSRTRAWTRPASATSPSGWAPIARRCTTTTAASRRSSSRWSGRAWRRSSWPARTSPSSGRVRHRPAAAAGGVAAGGLRAALPVHSPLHPGGHEPGTGRRHDRRRGTEGAGAAVRGCDRANNPRRRHLGRVPAGPRRAAGHVRDPRRGQLDPPLVRAGRAAHRRRGRADVRGHLPAGRPGGPPAPVVRVLSAGSAALGT